MKSLIENRRLAALLVSVAALSGCGGTEAPRPTFRALFDVTTETGEPVMGAKIFVGDRAAGSTGNDGRLVADFPAIEGDTLDLSVRCPETLVDPTAVPPLTVVSTHTVEGANSATPMKRTFVCARAEREIAVVIRAPKGANLPVLVDGKQVATTNEDGNAHIVITRLPTDGPVSVQLDTSAQPALVPKSPRREIPNRGEDKLVLLDQEFSLPSPPRSRPPRRPPAPRVPYRVN